MKEPVLVVLTRHIPTAFEIMEDLPNGVAESLEFERRNWAQGSVLDDHFYKAPHKTSESPLGTLLKIEKDVDTAKYLLPPTTAFSRFIYQSATLNGSKVPVSAYVLWPYSPRTQPDGYPVVAWAHGTSGFDANAAPSHHKNLWQHFLAPYQIALQGYVVVATDYAGLGVGRYSSEEPIVHEYLASPSQANDVIYSVTAAQAAFPELSKRFVVIGHSQGGGAAWSVAQRAATHDISGYLGAIAVSPYTSALEEPNEFAKILAAAMCPGLAFAVPEFKLGDLLTTEGERRLELVHQTGAAISSAVMLLSGMDILKPNWRDNSYLREYLQRTHNGGKAIKGPLLITHGTSDPVLSVTVVEDAVRKTMERFPPTQSTIQYVSLPNVTHVSALAASQHLWMDWIADRFAEHDVESTCNWSELVCARPDSAQQIDQNWYLESATEPYHAPGP